jgi:hypothetical protein
VTLPDAFAASGRAAELTVAVILAVAGMVKLADLDTTRTSIGRLLAPHRSLRQSVGFGLAIGLGATELGVAVLLVATPSLPVDLGSVLLTCGFVCVVALAHRRGVACGCFGSFSIGASGPAERRRAVALACVAAIALASLIAARSTTAGTPSIVQVTIAVAVFLGIIVAAAHDRDRRGAGSLAKLTFAGRAVDHDGWKRPLPWDRARVLRAVRADPATSEVITRGQLGSPSWMTARVRIRSRETPVAVVVVKAVRGQLHAFWRPNPGPAAALAVIGYGPTGVVVPTAAASPDGAMPARG